MDDFLIQTPTGARMLHVRGDTADVKGAFTGPNRDMLDHHLSIDGPGVSITARQFYSIATARAVRTKGPVVIGHIVQDLFFCIPPDLPQRMDALVSTCDPSDPYWQQALSRALYDPATRTLHPHVRHL